MTTRDPSVRGSAEATRVVCVECGDEINTRDRSGSIEREVKGWEALRRKGGANKIASRVETGRWRHRACVPIEIPGQTSIWDELGEVE